MSVRSSSRREWGNWVNRFIRVNENLGQHPHVMTYPLYFRYERLYLLKGQLCFIIIGSIYLVFRYEHVQLHDERNGKEFVVEFDFLGKDSIRYVYNFLNHLSVTDGRTYRLRLQS